MKGINKAIQGSRRVSYNKSMYYNLMYNTKTDEVWVDEYVGGENWIDYGNKNIVRLKSGRLKLTREIIIGLVKRYKMERA